MPPSNIKKLLIKFVSYSATAQDLEDLEFWIKESNNHLFLKEFIKIQFVIQFSMNDPDSSKVRARLLKEIRKDKSIFRRRRINSVLRYAAVALVFITIGYLFKTDFLAQGNEKLVIPKQNAITLQLENGNIEMLSEKSNSQVLNAAGKIIGMQSGNRIRYDINDEITTLTYNTLTVPYGKRFEIMLSDSTEVFLNSGSKLKYPVKFIEGKERNVFLEGEAFFNVAHDTAHPFVVKAQELEVEVLGTSFNVSNYQEDRDTEVVLVNGSVELATSGSLVGSSKVVLKPGYKASFNKSEKNISSKSVNTTMYTSWMKGQIVFRNSSFDDILQKLQRHYNVIIINNNKEINNETFNATIEVDTESIEQVLGYFDKIYGIDYELLNNKIIIN